MKKIYAVLFLVALGGWFTYWALGSDKLGPDKGMRVSGSTAQNSQVSFALPDISREEYTRKELPNGTIIFERVEPASANTAQNTAANNSGGKNSGGTNSYDNLDAIMPAAGPGANPAAGGVVNQTHYDPLTQTFRRTTIDSEGNSRQEIINHPANR